MRIASLGHAVFALTLVGLGVQGLVTGDFTAIWQPVPRAVAAREVLVYLCALVPLACGLGLLWQRTAAPAAALMLVSLLLCLLLSRVPGVVHAPTVEAAWSGCGEAAVLAAAAWVLYARFAADQGKRRSAWASGERGLGIARALYGLALIPFGLAHFAYLQATASLVPGWLPWHLAWACFTGAAYIAAAIGVLIGVSARLAAALSALQMAAFTLLVWLPIVAAGNADAFQRSEAILSWALTAAAWVVADSYRGLPWLALDKRWPRVFGRAGDGAPSAHADI